MLPEQMHAVQLDGGGLVVRRFPVPRPGPGEVLIRIAAAPINPSDLRFLSGASQRSDAAVVPGLEGSGTVVAAGGGVLARWLVGRRVAFASTQGGTWAEYAVVPAIRSIPLRRNVSLEQGASLIVNPLTAIAFFDMVKRGGHRAIVNNAAASALGRMILRLGQRSSVAVINIVRRQEQVDLLKTLGARYVLDSSSDRFAVELRDLAHQLDARLAFDAVGGPHTQTLVGALPAKSTVVVYAGLAGEPSVFNPLAIAGEDKKIVGFYLGTWMAGRGIVGMLNDIRRVQRLVGKDLQTSIQSRVPLSEAQTALERYRANMTAGKILLVADPAEIPVTVPAEVSLSPA